MDKKSLLASSFVLVFSQFIERTELVGENRKMVVGRLQDNPRRLGNGWVRLVDSTPLCESKDFCGRQDSPVPLAAFARRRFTRKQELSGKER